MCGILGFTHFAKPLPPDLLDRAAASVLHRGPDGRGTFVCSQVSLASTRLGILDLQSGAQPFLSEDGNVALVFNGEIFNHAALRDELRAEGCQFKTRCDTEVILHAFLRWGTSCFSRLRGMFAIAIWDGRRNVLVLARDSAGIKPLYFYLGGGELYFGSELKTILEHPCVPRNICLAGLSCYLRLNYVPWPYTLVEGIRKLSPGHILEFRGEQLSETAFLPQRESSFSGSNPEDLHDELEMLLSSAVQEQLMSDTPVGVWLSGGLDSSTILHYAVSHRRDRVRTFSITFKGRSFDESAQIHELVRHYGTCHTEMNLDASLDLRGAIEQMAYYSDEPSGDAGALPVWFLSQMTSETTRVALSGEGSDELFAGYLTHKADRYARIVRKAPQLALRAAQKLAELMPVSDEKIGFEYKIKRFLEGALLTPEEAHVFWNGSFSEQELAQLSRHPDPKCFAGILERMQPGTGLQRFLNFDQSHYLPDDLLYKVDRMSMAHSVEVRPPFLDSRVVQFCNALPEKYKLRGRTSKWLLRSLMKSRLPKKAQTNRKVGLDIPVHEWLRTCLRGLLMETLSEEAVKQTGLFDWPYVRRLIAEHTNRKANWGYELWGLMVLMIWIRRWNIQSEWEGHRPQNQSSELLDAVGST
ncbi:MAG TPA: asparagine synthase (glutamine-hydrolyzing) [Terriglobales bacterium]